MPSEREKTIYHKDLLPVVFVFGDTAANWIRAVMACSHARALKDRRWNRAGTMANFIRRRPILRGFS